MSELKAPFVQKTERLSEQAPVQQSPGNWAGFFLRHRWVLGLLVCLFVVESRLYTIKRFGVQEPYMDSFSEIYDYLPVVENDWAKVWVNSFRPNNEHRIVLTRWTNVGLFLLNGERWDLLTEACFNAFLAGLLAGALFVGVGRYFTDPPFLFFHGDKDRLVNVNQSQKLAKRLQAAGVPARVEVLEGEGHGWGGAELDRTLQQTVDFFQEKLKK